jgi:hypothetical protein
MHIAFQKKTCLALIGIAEGAAELANTFTDNFQDLYVRYFRDTTRGDDKMHRQMLVTDSG